jgi:RNAse (barnase) inhibitor barstar
VSKQRYIIDGDKFSSLEEFFEQISSIVLAGAPYGKNLDAFNDILRGGFGTPETGFILEWKNSELSRKRLGYEETVRQLERRLQRCHPQNRSSVFRQLEEAKRGEGPIVFDWLIEIIQRHGAGGDESEDGVELILS